MVPDSVCAEACRISRRLVGICPKCGAGVYEFERGYFCGSHCGFVVWREIAGREITPQEARTLLAEGKTPLLDGFISRRTKKNFSARLVLDTKTSKMKFDFGRDRYR